MPSPDADVLVRGYRRRLNIMTASTYLKPSDTDPDAIFVLRQARRQDPVNMVEASQNGSTPKSTMPDAVYGFIGLGNMGFGMAKNLRASMPKQCKLVVCELSTERRDEFISSVKGLVEAADSPRSIAEQCVR